MAEYILDLFEAETTRGEAELTVAGFHRQFCWVNSAMPPAQKLLKEWRLREPLELRSPAPLPVIRAVISTALHWGWTSFALCMWLGFVCLLRPGEICGLKKEDIRFYTGQFRALGFRRIGVVVIHKPKTRKVGARKQHVRIEEAPLLKVLALFLARLALGELLWPFSQAPMANRLAAVLAFLGCPEFFPLAGLRAGGATHMWTMFRRFELLRLKGR